MPCLGYSNSDRDFPFLAAFPDTGNQDSETSSAAAAGSTLE